MCKPHHVNCIVPMHMLRGLLEHRQKKYREMALNTLLVSERTRAQRSAMMGLRTIARVGHGLNRTIFDMRGSEFPLPGQRVRMEGAAASGDDDVNLAYDGLGDTYRFFHEVLGRDSIDGNGMPLDASVHYGTNYQNAFWNGQQMVFGDGDGTVFLPFVRSVDVIGHELAHGVTETSSGLIYANHSGALNESFSDVFGSLVKQYINDEDVTGADWLIGNDIIGPTINGDALRSMKDPGSAYDDPRLGGKDPQPGHMDDFVNLPNTPAGDFGGVHINSGIPNKAFYLTATKLGGKAWTAAGKIWYQTLIALNPNSDFAECAATSISMAQQLYGTGSTEHKAVSESWSEVGVEDQLKIAARSAPKAGSRAKRKDTGKSTASLRESLERLSESIGEVLDSLEEV